MEYHVMNVSYICRKFQNDLSFIYEDMGPLSRGHIKPNPSAFGNSGTVRNNPRKVSGRT